MKTKDGRHHTPLRVESLSLKIADDVMLSSVYQFDVDVTFDYAAEMYSLDSEQPSESSWCDLLSVKIVDRAYLCGVLGMSVQLDPRFELLEVLSEKQQAAVADAVMLRQEGVKL